MTYKRITYDKTVKDHVNLILTGLNAEIEKCDRSIVSNTMRLHKGRIKSALPTHIDGMPDAVIIDDTKHQCDRRIALCLILNHLNSLPE